MAISKIRAFQTSDGQVFSNEVDALKHEFLVTIRRKIEGLFSDFVLSDFEKRGPEDRVLDETYFRRQEIVDYLVKEKVIIQLIEMFNGKDVEEIKDFYKTRSKG